MPISKEKFNREGKSVIKKMNPDERFNYLIENFQSYFEKFENNNPFTGPSEYFYINKIIPATNDDYSAVFTNENIEWIYATLASWGMHRMGPSDMGAKMNDFKLFKKCIIQNEDNILSLKDLKLHEVNIVDYMDDINDLYFSFWPLMESNSKLVATSKVMHFLLPKLIPPIDRQYTMKFFGKNIPTIKSAEDKKNIVKENQIFQYTLNKFYHISQEVDCTQFINSEFSPTVPKVIDNAIVSFGIEKKKMMEK
ncbi:MAG: hypothetical protein KAS32_20460 [Candidatus Peribacteraceae bacterium]|nr:hypothetical protein [Candidatus Peribacteraceae bacterium]